MYLISIYFDQESNQKISAYMKEIATITDNKIMTDGDVPPHITISSFDVREEVQAKEAFLRMQSALSEEFKKSEWGRGGSDHRKEVTFVSVASFVSGAIFLTPVLNEFLQKLSEISYESLTLDPTIRLSRQYRPYSWFPHATLAKKLSNEDMVAAFAHLHGLFQPFSAKIVSIGLAKTRPYKDLMKLDLSQLQYNLQLK